MYSVPIKTNMNEEEWLEWVTLVQICKIHLAFKGSSLVSTAGLSEEPDKDCAGFNRVASNNGYPIEMPEQGNPRQPIL